MARAGQLNKRITFQSEIRTADGGGGFARSWGGDLTVWGQFVPERGSERLEAGRLEASLAGIVRVRHSSETAAIGESHRVLIDGEPFQIRSIANPDQRRRVLEFTVEKGVAI